MKKIIFTFTISAICLVVNGQRPSVEKSTFGIQTGLLGIWGYNELRLSNTIALRSEIGFDSGIWGKKYYGKTRFVMAPVITLEPRIYYNLKRRSAKSKRIDGNSGNYVSFKTMYHPDWFVLSNFEDLIILSDISFMPTWGIRRNIGNHFNYETGIGVGFRYIFAKKAGFPTNGYDIGINLHLRIGYRF